MSFLRKSGVAWLKNGGVSGSFLGSRMAVQKFSENYSAIDGQTNNYLKICAAKQRKDFFGRAEKVRKMSVDFRSKLWYVVLLTKGRSEERRVGKECGS